MSELTMKVTMPVLEELAKRDEGFVVKLSHAAAKEIGEKYSDAIIKSAVVQKALDKLEGAIVAAQVEAGSQLEQKIGQWDQSYRTGYKLRIDVIGYIETHFKEIIRRRFEEWFKGQDVAAMLDAIAKNYVERKVEELLKKQVGEFLRGKW